MGMVQVALKWPPIDSSSMYWTILSDDNWLYIYILATTTVCNLELERKTNHIRLLPARPGSSLAVRCLFIVRSLQPVMLVIDVTQLRPYRPALPDVFRLSLQAA